MAQKYSFRDATTQVLKCWGYVESNGPDDVRQEEADDFGLEPRKWRWTGHTWEPYEAPPI